MLAASDVCVATLKNIRMFSTTYPNKVFDYMAAGRPIALAIDGVIRQVVEAAGGGILFRRAIRTRWPKSFAGCMTIAQPPGPWGKNRGVTSNNTLIAPNKPTFCADWWSDWQSMGARRRKIRRTSRRPPGASRSIYFRKVAALQPNRGTCSPMYRRFGKRMFDLALVIPALVVLAPVIALTALAARMAMGRGVLYRQERPGLHGQPFRLYKFRTMIDAYDEHGNPLSDAERLTPFGHWLRKFSLDELPQLWNVLRGDMSLVGPRPLVIRYLPRYTPEQFRRHEVRPGLTGWTQTNGRNALSWDQKFQFDVWYVDHLSLWLDVKIIARTFWLVLRRANVSAEGHATMPEFMGSAANSGSAEPASSSVRVS